MLLGHYFRIVRPCLEKNHYGVISLPKTWLSISNSYHAHDYLEAVRAVDFGVLK